MSSIRYPVLVCLGAAILAAASPVGAASAPEASALPEAASAFVRDLGDRVVELRRAPDRSRAARHAAFRELLARKFDMRLIGRYAVGRHWRRASAAQRRDYLALFREYVVLTYAERLGRDGGERLEVVSGRALANGRDVLVAARIRRPSRPPIETTLRVRETGRGLRIVDVLVAGASMVVTQREEFGAVVRRRGMDGLLEILRARIADLSATDG